MVSSFTIFDLLFYYCFGWIKTALQALIRTNEKPPDLMKYKGSSAFYNKKRSCSHDNGLIVYDR